jgi:hypothetical protein
MADKQKRAGQSSTELERLHRANLNRLTRMQINQDRGSQAWTKFLIAIQGGLGAAFGYTLLQLDKGNFARVCLAVLVGVIGIVTLNVCRDIIERTHKWSTWFIRKYNLMVGFEHTIFPVSREEREKPPGTKVSEMPPGGIFERIDRFCNCARAGWAIGIIIALGIYFFGPPKFT